MPVTPYSLPSVSSAQTLRTRASARVVTDGRVDGWTGGRSSKRSFNFFLFWDILNTILIYTYIRKKNCLDKYLVGLYLVKLENCPQRFSKSYCKADFFQNQSQSRLFKKNTKDFLLKWTQIKFKLNYFICSKSDQSCVNYKGFLTEIWRQTQLFW